MKGVSPNINEGNAFLLLSRNSRNLIKTFLQSNPLLMKELEILAPNSEKNCEIGTKSYF